MEFPIKRDQLQSGDVFRQQIEIEEQRKLINQYVNNVTTLIAKEIIFRLNNKDIKRYVYRFQKHGLNNHPNLPQFVHRKLNTIYQNDIKNIYPTEEIFKELQNKFPDCKITMDQDTCNITIDWS
jgi:predicted GTPase